MKYILSGNRIYTLQVKLCDRTLGGDYEDAFSDAFDAQDHDEAMQRAKVKVLARSRLSGKAQEFGIWAALSVADDTEPFWRAQFLSLKPLTRATWNRFDVKVDPTMVRVEVHTGKFRELPETD